MKKTLLCLLLILFAITSLYADEVERDKNDPLQNLKIGDKFTIIKTSTENETTFDFTGLGIDDSMVGKVGLVVRFYKNNKPDFEEIFSISLLKTKSDDNYMDWFFISSTYNRIDEIENIASSCFKQTIKHNDNNKELLTKYTDRTSILLYYYPEGIKTYNHCFMYLLKTENNGNGEIEVVGYTILTPNGGESKGDMYTSLPRIDKNNK